ncbi:hypothetical protein [Microvirga massiliensis]|uniref:hypothetical protein n=1 Tax=Microvirga massiliensis TaxID=1033741 RepID=UPI00065FE362|nr:hypothetical protein [Microvirga massiliensis]
MGSRFSLALISAFVVTVALLSLVGIAIGRLTFGAPLERFRAGSFEFALAPGWWCEREGTEYVCNPPGPPPYASTVIMAVKERSEDDSLEAYERHLQILSASDGEATSAGTPAEYIARRMLGSREWVEALRVGSELPRYHTYYLATVTSALGILVTMSVHQNHVETYREQLITTMSTLNTYQQ